MEYLLSILLIVMENFSILLFCDGFFQRRNGNKQLAVAFAALTVGGVVLSVLFQSYMWAHSVSVIVLIFLMCHYAYQGSITLQALFSVLIYALYYAVDAGCLAAMTTLFHVDVGDIIQSPLLFTVEGISARLVMLLIGVALKRARIPLKAKKIAWPKLLISMIFPATSLIVLVALTDAAIGNPLGEGLSLFLIVLLAAANMSTIFLIDWMDKEATAQEESAALHQRIQLQIESISALNEAYAAQRKMTHDFRAHLDTILGLLTQQKIPQATDYVAHLQSEPSGRILAVNTHNAILDALLNQKAYVAAREKIELNFEVNDLSHMWLSPEDSAVLLANLLDNAIEACEKMDGHRCIEIKLLLDQSFFLSVRNTSSAVTIVDNTIATTKKDAAGHGYGLPGIKAILDKYGAEYAMNYDSGWFQFTAEVEKSLRS